jgi:hypothetical protein
MSGSLAAVLQCEVVSCPLWRYRQRDEKVTQP